jgi:ADP-ribosylglycohydrolase
MLGAIAGDIIGSIYEGHGKAIKSEVFPLFADRCRFTDDTVLTVAVAEVLLTGGSYTEAFRTYAQRYPHAGYGGTFRAWMASEHANPYCSFGNGSAMRVSPVGWAFDSLEEVLAEAERSAAVTHNHPEGIKGAQAVALAIFLARHKAAKAEIRREIASRFNYNLDKSVAEIRPTYTFDVTCQGSVPQAIVAFMDSNSVEDAIRKAISLGGDSDTQAAIAGSIAEAFYGFVPEGITSRVVEILDPPLWAVVERFRQKFVPGS